MHEDTRNLTEQHIFSRILKKATRPKIKMKMAKNKTLWGFPNNLYAQPISWQYFPVKHVMSGKWYKEELLRYFLSSAILSHGLIFQGNIQWKLVVSSFQLDCWFN